MEQPSGNLIKKEEAGGAMNNSMTNWHFPTLMLLLHFTMFPDPSKASYCEPIFTYSPWLCCRAWAELSLLALLFILFCLAYLTRVHCYQGPAVAYKYIALLLLPSLPSSSFIIFHLQTFKDSLRSLWTIDIYFLKCVPLSSIPYNGIESVWQPPSWRWRLRPVGYPWRRALSNPQFDERLRL